MSIPKALRFCAISEATVPVIAVWPGKVPFPFERVLRRSGGAAVNSSTLTLSSHTGSRPGVPYHIAADDLHPADPPLENYPGPVHMITLAQRRRTL
jgi:kynurenine formamidase